MLSNDFTRYVNKYKLRAWAVVRVGRRMSQIFAQHFVLGITGGKSHKRVLQRTTKLRKLWANRIKELTAGQLWLFTKNNIKPNDPEFGMKNFALTLRRLLFCRPGFLYYRWRDGHAVYRPCNRTHLCPWCAARVASAQYRYVKKRVRRLGRCNDQTRLVFTTRIVRQFVPAAGFDPILGCDPEQLPRYSQVLQNALYAHKNAYALCSRRLRRNTLGSMWKVVVIPQDTGWFVESRQCFIKYPDKPVPGLSIRGAKVIYRRSVKISECYDKVDSPFFAALGAFAEYPIELLTGYVELVAVYLQASHSLRMAAGTGILRRTERSLISLARQEIPYGAPAKARKTGTVSLPASQETADPQQQKVTVR